MAKRRRISTTERVAIFKRHGGICDICSGKIAAAELWEVSHRVCLELGGADDASNWFPAHKSCHRDHTARIDQPDIARAKRREASHLGAKAPTPRPLRSAGFPKTSAKRQRNPTPLPERQPLFVEEVEMSKRWSEREDRFLHAYFDVVGDYVGTHDLGRPHGAATKRVAKLKQCGAWAALDDERAAHDRYRHALGIFTPDEQDERGCQA